MSIPPVYDVDCASFQTAGSERLVLTFCSVLGTAIRMFDFYHMHTFIGWGQAKATKTLQTVGECLSEYLLSRHMPFSINIIAKTNEMEITTQFFAPFDVVV